MFSDSHTLERNKFRSELSRLSISLGLNFIAFLSLIPNTILDIFIMRYSRHERIKTITQKIIIRKHDPRLLKTTKERIVSELKLIKKIIAVVKVVNKKIHNRNKDIALVSRLCLRSISLSKVSLITL